jgi:hypothetical protein
MLIQFKTEDGNSWRCNTLNRTWQKFLAGACPQNGQEATPAESGKLTAQTMGVYSLAGRTPPDLCSFGIFFDGAGEVLTVYVRANVDVTELTMPVPFKTIQYKVVSAAPAPKVQMQTRTIKMR